MLPTLLVASALNFPVAPQMIPQNPDTLVHAFGLKDRFTLESLLELNSEWDIPVLQEELEELVEERSRARRRPAERFTFGISRGRGKESAEWKGSPVRWWCRGEVRLHQCVTAGVTLEKDAGERVGLGHFSGFLSGEGLIEGVSFIFGDYRFASGSRLQFGQGHSRGGPALLPNRGRSEFGYLRGGALQVAPGKGRATVSLFISDRKLAGHAGAEGFILDRVGLYRTAAEEAERNGTRESLLGFHCAITPARGVEISASLVAARLGDPLDGAKYGLPRASSFLYLHAGGEVSRGRASIRMEVDRGGRGGWGATLEWSELFGRSGEFILRGEARSKDFWDYRATGSESNRARVECGATLPIGKSVELYSWINHWWRLRPLEGECSRLRGTSCSFGLSAGLPSGGEVTFELSRSIREEERIGLTDGRGSARQIFLRSRTALRPGLRLRLGRWLEWRMRGNGVIFDEPKSGLHQSGVGCTQELRWSFHSRCSLAGWSSLYFSPSYDCSLYFLEPDPIRANTLSGCTGRGERFGVTLTVSFLGVNSTLYWAGESRIPSDPAEAPELNGSVGCRVSAPL